MKQPMTEQELVTFEEEFIKAWQDLGEVISRIYQGESSYVRALGESLIPRWQDPSFLAICTQYALSLVARNRHLNLTAVTEPQGVVERHFLDSLLPLPFVQSSGLDSGSEHRWVDVGTGAGFPGIPLQLAGNWGRLCLMDSLQKRLRFLDELIALLPVPRTQTHHARAEEAGRDPLMRGQHQLVVARAVAPLPILCELCLPLLQVGGSFVVLKGPGENLRDADSAIKKLGGEWRARESLVLPSGAQRVLGVIQLKKPVPRGYPRRPGEPSRSPL